MDILLTRPDAIEHGIAPEQPAAKIHGIGYRPYVTN